MRISIHALARSATRGYNVLRILYIKFQSTHSRGVRQRARKSGNTNKRISIHALARSATNLVRVCKEYLIDFNPRTREECDRMYTDKHNLVVAFQSTHSRGVRRYYIDKDSIRRYISIHALARSATTKFEPYREEEQYFNPRTREECDLLKPTMHHSKLLISIHALARSATAIYCTLLRKKYLKHTIFLKSLFYK